MYSRMMWSFRFYDPPLPPPSRPWSFTKYTCVFISLLHSPLRVQCSNAAPCTNMSISQVDLAPTSGTGGGHFVCSHTDPQITNSTPGAC